MDSNTAYIELGGNIGNRLKLINEAKTELKYHDCTIIKQSSVYETPPWGFSAEQNFYNQVVCIITNKTAIELLNLLMQIENKLGRVRGNERYASRTIDLDILFFNSEIINNQRLIIPHERLHLRNFVLEPLNEIAPKLQHPVFNKNIETLLFECTDASICKKLG